MFYLNSTLNFGIPPVLVFQLEVYYKEDILLTGLLLNQKEQLLDGIQIKHLYSKSNSIPLHQDLLHISESCNNCNNFAFIMTNKKGTKG